ncbi:hypothetical protein SAMN05192533_102286 [Mesobacillus persicus]|uniref:Uncharacterized protein n=1 Tax=Mesobacillus persicus TaxID=930146 RepID=A0A1H7XNE1_9BACI|nr:hypothetical protein SAMN05192533_102286 [Mesobacillus persicus]
MKGCQHELYPCYFKQIEAVRCMKCNQIYLEMSVFKNQLTYKEVEDVLQKRKGNDSED